MNFLYNGSDELEKLEFISRQQLLQEDKIMRDKLNNYVQLVAALTGEEVFLPLDDDEYTFVSISSGEDEEECIIEYIDEDEWDYEPIHDEEEHPFSGMEEEGEEISSSETLTENYVIVENMPPTPSQIIRKVKADLVEAGIENRRLGLKRKKSRRLNGNNWTYDMARRRLKRELIRIKRRNISRAIRGGQTENAPSQDLYDKTTSPARDFSSSVQSSGSVFVSLLKSLEISGRKPEQQNSYKGTVKLSRSDERLKTILQKHHRGLLDKRGTTNSSNSNYLSPPPPPPPPPLLNPLSRSC
jgi:hypothetical protein